MPRKSREGHRFCLGFLLPWRCTNSCFYLPDGLHAAGNSATLHHSGRVREELDTISSEPKPCHETSPFKNSLLLKPKNIWVPYFEGLFYLVFSLLVLLFLSGFSFPLWTRFSNSCLLKVERAVSGVSCLECRQSSLFCSRPNRMSFFPEDKKHCWLYLLLISTCLISRFTSNSHPLVLVG